MQPPDTALLPNIQAHLGRPLNQGKTRPAWMSPEFSQLTGGMPLGLEMIAAREATPTDSRQANLQDLYMRSQNRLLGQMYAQGFPRNLPAVNASGMSVLRERLGDQPLPVNVSPSLGDGVGGVAHHNAPRFFGTDYRLRPDTIEVNDQALQSVPHNIPRILNHEQEHLRQLANEPRATEGGNYEIAPSLGDNIFLGEQFQREMRRPLQATWTGGGKQHDIQWMLDRAREHGYFDGRSMQDLLNTPSGMAYTRQLLHNPNADAAGVSPMDTSESRDIDVDVWRRLARARLPNNNFRPAAFDPQTTLHMGNLARQRDRLPPVTLQEVMTQPGILSPWFK